MTAACRHPPAPRARLELHGESSSEGGCRPQLAPSAMGDGGRGLRGHGARLSRNAPVRICLRRRSAGISEPSFARMAIFPPVIHLACARGDLSGGGWELLSSVAAGVAADELCVVWSRSCWVARDDGALSCVCDLSGV